jgi:NADH-ubiquinone reductase complex 1 MLRQ subunit
MAPFNRLPKDVYPLVAATLVGVTMMTASAYHALFNSPEVHLTKRTRTDELLEEQDIASKGAAVRSRSPFAWLGSRRN